MEAARGNIQSSPVPRQPVVQEAQNPMDSFSPDVPDYQQSEKEGLFYSKKREKMMYLVL